MSLSIKFKTAERSFLHFLSKNLGFIGRGFIRMWKGLSQASKTRFTVMLIPHSEKKVVNFKISAFMLIFIGGFFSALITIAFASVILFSVSTQSNRENSGELAMVQQDNRNYYKAINEFYQPYRSFQTTLQEMLKSHLPPEMTQSRNSDGDFQDISLIEETKNGQTPHTSVLKEITENLGVYTNAINEYSEQQSRVNDLLRVIPSKWPVGHNQGYISAKFGPAPHPIKKIWYLHKGTDIAATRGTSIYATADGRVVEQQYNQTYGNYILIRHQYGFYSKYAHLDNAYVKEGDVVTQGQCIGALGNTGSSSGPHLHYEIRINSEVVDPERYINLQRK